MMDVKGDFDKVYGKQQFSGINRETKMIPIK